ncbi:hypothetical protein E4K72_13560 [Oxalobacteraceae bacterium OM1]|nr:hypothetical protein E4K72_13560 [Oxalobacteraceae bacterium OM1]
MDKRALIARIRSELAAARMLRDAATRDPGISAARVVLRRYQSGRMAHTHQDFLSAAATRAAAQFFLEDVYGAGDLSQRDADLERIVPVMERLLPGAALATVADALALDALSERLDGVMAGRLGVRFDEREYLAVYPKVTARIDRDRQLDLVAALGDSLCKLVRVPLLGATLTAMRKPAKLAGLGELQDFLERGFSAFKTMPDPAYFVRTVVARERRILEAIFAGEAEPFAVGSRP